MMSVAQKAYEEINVSIEEVPTIPIENIYYLLTYAWNLLEERKALDVSIEDSKSPAELFGRVLCAGLLKILRTGLDRTYLEYNEDLRSVKGKLNISRSVKRQLFPVGKASCEFDELSYDVLANQIIVSTLFRLGSLKGMDKTLTSKIWGLLRRVKGISKINIKTSDFRQVKIHRNNKNYRLLLSICRLVHDNLSIKEDQSDVAFKDFEKDGLPKLFEKFVLNFYKEEQSIYTSNARKIEWDFTPITKGAEGYMPRLNTDITLENHERRIVIDAKFYKSSLAEVHGKSVVHSGNLYQIMAYLKNFEAKDLLAGNKIVQEGILLYPRVYESVSLEYIIWGKRVRVESINLASPWNQIHNQLIALIK